MSSCRAPLRFHPICHTLLRWHHSCSESAVSPPSPCHPWRWINHQPAINIIGFGPGNLCSSCGDLCLLLCVSETLRHSLVKVPVCPLGQFVGAYSVGVLIELQSSVNSALLHYTNRLVEPDLAFGSSCLLATVLSGDNGRSMIEIEIGCWSIGITWTFGCSTKR